MFGPLKFISYGFLMFGIVYAGLYLLPSFIAVEQIETRVTINVPTPILVD